MKVSREQAAQNRERILDAAARLFRERGFDGIGVADLMKEAGLTHGGFYGHFEGKDDLVAATVTRMFEEVVEYRRKAIEGAPKGKELAAIVKSALTPSVTVIPPVIVSIFSRYSFISSGAAAAALAKTLPLATSQNT